jgi:hypothetical protein
MTRYSRTVLCGVAAASCLACFSQFPLDPSPKVKVDAQIVGVWRCVPPDAEESDDAIVTVTEHAGPDSQYEITWQERDKAAEHYRAFASLVGGSTFLNVRAADNKLGSEGWAFVRYSTLRENVLYGEMARERLFKEKEASASVALARATLEDALAVTPDALQGFCLCVRKEKSAAPQ